MHWRSFDRQPPTRLVAGVFFQDEKRILTWSGGTTRIWETATGKQIGRSLQHKEDVNGAVFSQDEKRILTWSGDATARIWDAATGKQIGPSLQHENYVRGAVFFQNEKRILTWSGDGTTRIWDAATGKQIGPSLQHEDWFIGAVFSRDEKRILTWSSDRTARIWDVPGDLDFPKDKFMLQVEALTGTRYDPDTRQITVIPPDEFYEIQKEYLDFAHEHAKTCQYKRQNVYLRFFPDTEEK